MSITSLIGYTPDEDYPPELLSCGISTDKVISPFEAVNFAAK